MTASLFDDASFVTASAAPLPGSVILLITGLLGLIISRRKANNVQPQDKI